MKKRSPKDIKKSALQGKNTIAENEKPTLDFPVVAVGASAGGLEALQDFFKNAPEDSGAAYVVIQHLSPDYKSLMAELLGRVTNMYIYRVEDGMAVQQNCIYLIPPGHNMTIFKGKLFLTKQQHGRSLNLPIDIFMRSLAKDQGKNAIGIVLSGTGSDGTLGIRAIKEYGGMVMAQDDESAKFDGMPRSSINTGMVDYILPAKVMPKELTNYIKHPLIRKTSVNDAELDENDNHLAKIIMILRDEKGVDFSGYKSNTIIRRLEKRISINRYSTVAQYADFLIDNKKEVNILFKEFLIGVTRFFRDEEAFDHIYNDVLPKLFADKTNKKPLRLWTIACSTGEEAYSLAILVKEYMDKNNINREVKIFSTDIDADSIEFASMGRYPESIASDISAERLSKFFNRKDESYQISEKIRSMVVFAQHNILRDPPFSKIDLLSCRNMLIYLNSDIQQKILSMFYLALKSSGYLFLGSSESIGDLSEGFQTVNTKWKIFQAKEGYSPSLSEKYTIPSYTGHKNELTNISSYYHRQKQKTPKVESIFDELMAEYLPPSVIVDENYDIIHTIHKVSKFMSIPVGKVSFNLLKMLPNELDVMVSSLLRRAAKTENTISYENINVEENEAKTLDISAKKIKSAQNGDIFFIVSFRENSIKEKVKTESKNVETLDINNQFQERIEELEKELQNKSESLQATVEELETSNEELQSSNEELIASNEELQSTNEELQSVNEELYTVNAEHQIKITELTQLNADMDNLLKNTQIGTLYLDQDLTIRKFTKLAADITNIMQTDVGRPIHHIASDHLYKGFHEDIHSVMDSLQAKEQEIKTPNNEWHLVRIIPFRTAENAVDGIIVTFVNITNLKKTEKEKSQLTSRLEMALEMGKLSWWEWDYLENEVIAGENKARMLGYHPNEIAPGFEGWTRLLHTED
ncbi:MAG: CheR family methyltransferase, partial [Salinivirgaceae bacterium]